MELMRMRVGAKNVEKKVKAVLEKLGEVEVGHLPGEIFAKYMLL